MQWEKAYKETLVSNKYVYFDTGAASVPPVPVLNEVKQYLDKTAELGTYLPSFRSEVYKKIEDIRELSSNFLNADIEEIAFIKNGTEGICLVAQGINWKKGDEVIVPDTEMQSNLAIWFLLQQTKGIKVVRIKADKEGIIDEKKIEEAITKKTKLITFISLSNATGAIQPISNLCKIAKKYGVLTLVNASQSIGILKTDVKEIGCDFLSACGRKGLRAIEGSGLLYVNKKQIKYMSPCIVGWWNSSMKNDNRSIEFPKTAKKFEAGCPNVPAIYALGAAIEYANIFGIDKIEKKVKKLTKYAVDQFLKIDNFVIYGPSNIEKRVGLIPFRIKNTDPSDLVKMLEQNGVIIEAGRFMAESILEFYKIDSMARISLHYFNRKKEIDKTLLLIKKFIKTQKGQR